MALVVENRRSLVRNPRPAHANKEVLVRVAALGLIPCALEEAVGGCADGVEAFFGGAAEGAGVVGVGVEGGVDGLVGAGGRGEEG